MFEFPKSLQNYQREPSATDLSAAAVTPDTRPSLQTARLWLRPFDLADADRFETLIDDPEIAINTRLPVHPLPAGSAANWIDAHLDLWISGRAVIFAICQTPLDQPLDPPQQRLPIIGTIGLEISIDDHRGELGYWLGRAYWSQGLASEAAAAVIDYGLDHLALNKITAHCLATNYASRRVLEKVGFKQEGHQRDHIRHWGRYHDLISWGLLYGDR